MVISTFTGSQTLILTNSLSNPLTRNLWQTYGTLADCLKSLWNRQHEASRNSFEGVAFRSCQALESDRYACNGSTLEARSNRKTESPDFWGIWEYETFWINNIQPKPCTLIASRFRVQELALSDGHKAQGHRLQSLVLSENTSPLDSHRSSIGFGLSVLPQGNAARHGCHSLGSEHPK